MTVSLRPMTAEDTPLIVRWRNNPRVRSNFVYRETFTPEIHERWIREHIEGAQDVVQWIILLADRPVGSVYFRDIERESGRAEYGIFLGEDDAVGCGVGNQAIDLALACAEGELNLKHIVLRVFTDNEPAIRSYEHAGFRVTKTLPAVRCSDGEERDMLFMERDL
ncbi:MAG: GNAT family N-acetyltransferase [Lachnospiraceae bacterium]|nr:GNAT family N-acetyltransferase [Lachnospiraceae bacterium]